MASTLHKKLARKSKFSPDPTAAWKAIAVANRVFGPAGWSRETVELRNPANSNRNGAFTSAYVAKVRVSVASEDGSCTRESHGCGEGLGASAFEAHDRGLKAAELDATFRALASIGPALGLDGFLEPPEPGAAPVANASPPNKENETFPGDRPIPPAKPKDARPAASEIEMAENEDAGELLLPKTRRLRSPQHLAHVRSQPCLICGRNPTDAHHVRYVQPRAMAKKVSDEFTVPLCRRHHDLLHRDPDEKAWWDAYNIDPLTIAAELWAESQGLSVAS